jgi:hypothetical protein
MCVDLGMGICIAFCEGNSGDLDCGDGFACERPAQALLYLDVARDANDEYVTCASAEDTSCGEITIDEGDYPYACIELTIGFTCARALKQCVQNMTVDAGTDDGTGDDAGTDDAGTDGTGTDG